MIRYINKGRLLETFLSIVLRMALTPSQQRYTTMMVALNRYYGTSMPITLSNHKRALTKAKMGGVQIAQGRGAMWDEIVLTICGGVAVSDIKTLGTNDITSGNNIIHLRKAHRKGQPMLIRCVDGDCPKVPTHWIGEIEEMPKNVRQRWVNITDVLNWCEENSEHSPWEDKVDDNQIAWTRMDRVYERLVINFNKIPAHLWLSEWMPLNDEPAPIRVNVELNTDIRTHRKCEGFAISGDKVTLDGETLEGFDNEMRRIWMGLCTNKGEPFAACKTQVNRIKRKMPKSERGRIKSKYGQGYYIVPKEV